jgi:D-alanine-D-alanine ligase
MDMTRVLVLSGGDSDEREVSLRSGKAVATALQGAGYDVVSADAREAESVLQDVDVIFPALHGLGGEDGQIQKLFEAHGLPFVGSDSAVSELCYDKWRWRELVSQNNVPIADGAVVSLDDVHQQPLINQPFVLKPFDGGSSIDTFIVRNPEDADWQQIETSFSRHPMMLIEALAPGIEITVGVLGDQALPVIEIVPPESGEFDYENKYNGATQELCPSLNIDHNIQQAAQELAAKVHHLCGCRDLSRTDMIVGEDGSLTVLETNTIPGLTEQSLFPKSAATAGLSMSQLCDQLVRMALSRRTVSA